jgi:dTDP-4-amino-4,6-dideoxygalactose transaminase
VDAAYRVFLADTKGIRCLGRAGETRANFAYFPVLVEPDYPLSRDGLYQLLRDNGIHARRYFYPLISDFPMYRGLPSASPSNLPVASQASRKVLCLPIYPGLQEDDLTRIVDTITGN